jgi:SHS2 domain-containing protein
MSPVTSPNDFEIVEHTADWALRIYGSDLAQLFTNAAVGMASLLVRDILEVPVEVERHLELDAYDAETLLVDWLTELAFWAEDEGLIFPVISLSEVTDTHLKATLKGGRVAGLLKHIKAVTYHNLEIMKTERGLSATVVFDV